MKLEFPIDIDLTFHGDSLLVGFALSCLCIIYFKFTKYILIFKLSHI